jgi:hypothetical protein
VMSSWLHLKWHPDAFLLLLNNFS